jgi:hypothetical protein
MAYIVTKSADTSCPLARASWDRQVDVYRLAKRGMDSCRRLWNDFEREQPGMARVIIADVEMDKAKDVKANRHLDLLLAKAEKPKKPKKAKPATPQKQLKALLKADLRSPDPWIRAAAEQALSE